MLWLWVRTCTVPFCTLVNFCLQEASHSIMLYKDVCLPVCLSEYDCYRTVTRVILRYLMCLFMAKLTRLWLKRLKVWKCGPKKYNVQMTISVCADISSLHVHLRIFDFFKNKIWSFEVQDYLILVDIILTHEWIYCVGGWVDEAYM